jgi:hypothetical protein
MMDWYTIEFLFPESFQRFTETMFPNIGIPSLSCLHLYDIKKLYKFFDNEGIFLTIEAYNSHHWVYTISLENGICFGPGCVSASSRFDIEVEGFSECFKILDKKIRGVM